MSRLVVYTCVTNGYDVIKKPSTLPSWADWKGLTEADSPDNREPKLLPHKLFPEYDYSLWLDGNIDVIDAAFWDKVASLMDSGCLYAGVKHPSRDDAYEESLRILKNGRETACRLRRTVRFLRSEGLPRHAGLNENNIILRRHNAAEVVAMDELWWSLYRRFSHRDQMTWSYCIWKTGLHTEYLLPEGTDVRHHPWFDYTVHDKPYRKDLFKDAARKVRVKAYELWLGL